MSSNAGQSTERRQHRRLAIRLPLECRLRGGPGPRVLRGLTGNVSSGGLYFETELTGAEADDCPEPGPAGGQLLDMELTVPPGDGHFPYEGRVSTVLEILRRVDLGADSTADRPRRIGLAGRFHQPLKLTF